ncbi:hypothetical protein WG907_15015 [Sphingobium sp. AN558]|uniref:hypothetical protein n=1 Tax=Sphingobium sp. AN558 TaxID=3133442 RepID=UPI0030C5D17E
MSSSPELLVVSAAAADWAMAARAPIPSDKTEHAASSDEAAKDDFNISLPFFSEYINRINDNSDGLLFLV